MDDTTAVDSRLRSASLSFGPWARALVALLVLCAALTMTGRPDVADAAVRGDDYPYRGGAIDQADPWGALTRECTSFVAFRLAQNGNTVRMNWGNAGQWDDTARARGYRVDATPAVGAVAQWDPYEGGAGRYGHVAYVSEVRGDGSVVVEEYNFTSAYNYGTRATRAPRYLHVRDVANPPPRGHYRDYNGDGRADLWFFNRNDNGRTAVHIMDGANPNRFLLQSVTAMHRTDNAPWDIKVGEYNGDGRADIWFFNRNDNGRTAVHVINGANPNEFLLHSLTAMHATDSSLWEIRVADYDANGRADLWFFNRNDNGRTAVHVLNGQNPNQFVLHSLTAMHQTQPNSLWAIKVGNYDGDGRADMWFMNRNDSGRTAVHVISGANPNAFLLHSLTAIHPTDNPLWWIEVGDYNVDGRADLWFFNRNDNGRTAVHVINGANPNEFLLHSLTAIHRTDSPLWSIA